MGRSLLVQIVSFLYLCGIVSLVLSAYREEEVSTILKETARRSAKFTLGIGLLAAIAYAVQRWIIDRG